MTAIHEPLDFICGDTWKLSGPVDDKPLDLAGATLTWRLDSVDGLINYLALNTDTNGGVNIMDVAAGTVLVTATKQQTAALKPGIYRDWLRVETANGSVYTVLTGVIRVTPSPV